MTVDEMLARESIRQTMAAYTVAGDRLREEDFLAVFTEDAVLESEGVAESDLFRHEGQEAIRQWIGRWRNPPADVGRTVRHHLATCHIELRRSQRRMTLAKKKPLLFRGGVGVVASVASVAAGTHTALSGLSPTPSPSTPSSATAPAR